MVELSVRGLQRADPSAPRIRPGRVEPVWVSGGVLAATAIGLTEPRTALAIVLVVALWLVSLARPIIGLTTLIATVPVQGEWPAKLGSMEITWTRLALVALAAAWFVRVALGKERIRLTPVAWAILAYCGALAASIVNAQDFGAWAKENYHWLVTALVFLMAISIVKATADRWWILFALSTGILFSAGIAVRQFLSESGPETFNQRGIPRVYGLFGEPNPFAGYLEIATLPLLAAGVVAFTHSTSKADRLRGAVALTVSIAGILTLLFTQSRGGLLGFAAGLGVITWFLWPYWGRRLVILAGLAAVTLILLPPAASIREAFGLDGVLNSGPVLVTPDNWAAQERLAHWGAALQMWAQHPWLGIGAGNFPDRFREFTPVWRFRIPRGHAHSAYLQAASQAGAVGLVCFISILAAAWRSETRRVAMTASAAASGRFVGAAAVTAAFAVHGLFDYLHVLSLGIVLSVVWAVGTAEEVKTLGESVRHAGD